MNNNRNFFRPILFVFALFVLALSASGQKLGGGSTPTATTAAESAITLTSANLNGSGNPNGDNATGWFRYSTTNPGACNDVFGTRAPSSGGFILGSGTSDVAYSQSISGLSPATTYFFCAIVQNSFGMAFGSILSFTTLTPPDYSVTTTGGAIVVTDLSGGSDTLDVTEPAANQIRFEEAGGTKTFSVNGGALITGNSGNLSRTGITSITVNGQGGDDTFNVSAFASMQSLTVNGGTGNDTVNFNGDITFASVANLDVDMQNDDATPGTDSVNTLANAKIVTSGTGTITVKVSKNVAMSSGSKFESVNGNITIEANQQATSTTGTFFGVNLDGATVQATGTGTLTVKGKGGTTGNSVGIGLGNSALIKGGSTSGTTTTTVVGTGGTGGNVHGIQIGGGTVSGSTISSFGGDVSVTGTAGAGGGTSLGIILFPTGSFGGVITSTGNGSVTVIGTGGTGGAVDNDGIRVNGSLSKISAAGTGTVTVTGTAGDGNSAGVMLSRDAGISSSGGLVTVTGTHGGGGGSGILLHPSGSSTIASIPNGTVTLIADRMDLVAGFVTAINSGIVNIRQKTSGQAINLGGADSSTQLGLTDAELDRVTAGTMTIGDANSGAVSVTLAITQTGKLTNIASPLTTTVTGSLGISGTITGPLSVSSGGELRPGTSPGVINSGNASLASGSTFFVEIGGTSPGNTATNHDQLNVTGTVALTSATLTTAGFGGFVPANGNTFVIINNDSNDAINGTFNGLPQGATIPNFAGTGPNATISYIGGDGNDVVLTAQVPSISGHVAYDGSITTFGKNVTMTLTGNNGFVTRMTTTDANGDYSFVNVPAGNDYTLTPSKIGDVGALHIESMDASKVARFVAGLEVPTTNQVIAADADGDGLLTSFDAALIARYVAGLGAPVGIVGTWKFVPVNRSYPALAANQTAQNFTAILVGDPDGNWQPALPSGGGESNVSSPQSSDATLAVLLPRSRYVSEPRVASTLGVRKK